MQMMKQLWQKHPRLVSWVVLSIGMVIIFLIASAGLELAPTQSLTMALATVVLAGLCVWIIYWE